MAQKEQEQTLQMDLEVGFGSRDYAKCGALREISVAVLLPLKSGVESNGLAEGSEMRNKVVSLALEFFHNSSKNTKDCFLDKENESGNSKLIVLAGK
jgi:hypothetical protein